MVAVGGHGGVNGHRRTLDVDATLLATGIASEHSSQTGRPPPPDGIIGAAQGTSHQESVLKRRKKWRPGLLCYESMPTEMLGIMLCESVARDELSRWQSRGVTR